MTSSKNDNRHCWTLPQLSGTTRLSICLSFQPFPKNSDKFLHHFDEHDSRKSRFSKMILKIKIFDLARNCAETIAYSCGSIYTNFYKVLTSFSNFVWTPKYKIWLFIEKYDFFQKKWQSSTLNSSKSIPKRQHIHFSVFTPILKACWQVFESFWRSRKSKI